MQVTAIQIVKSFGIEALSKFCTIDNINEIEQCRENWRIANSFSCEIHSFNDGNSIFEVEFYYNEVKAYRTDSSVDVTGAYIESCFKAYMKWRDCRKSFDLPVPDLGYALKAFTAAQ